jgi:hypothetical protein
MGGVARVTPSGSGAWPLCCAPGPFSGASALLVGASFSLAVALLALALFQAIEEGL